MGETSRSRKYELKAHGMKLKCDLSYPPGMDRNAVDNVARNLTQLERIMEASDQQELAFDEIATFNGVKIVSDKPKTKDRFFTFRIEAENFPMTERSAIFNLSQTKKLVVVKIESYQDPKANGKKPKATGEGTKADSAEPKAASVETEAPPAETKLANTETADHSADAREKIEPESTIDKAIKEALGDREFTSTQRCLSDNALANDIRDAWKEPINSTTPDGFCFVAIGAHGRNQQPRLHIAETPHIIPPINGKPAIQGAALIARVRELFNIPKPEKKKKGKAS